jgi:hypothetical protein
MTTRRGPHPGILLCIIVIAVGTILFMVVGSSSSSSAEAKMPPPSDDGIGRQDYRGMTPPPAPPVEPVYEQRQVMDGEVITVQNFRGMTPNPASPKPPPATPKPLAAGTLAIVCGADREVAIRNPEPLEGIRGQVYVFNSTCWIFQDDVLETLGNEGEQTLLRMKGYGVAEAETHCPIGAAFFLPEQQAREFVAYAEDQARRDEEERKSAEAAHRQEEEAQQRLEHERLAAEKLLQEYNRQHR